LDFIRVFNHHEQLVFSDTKISITEILSRRRPADRAELLAVDQQSMEERASEQQRLESLRVFGAVELLVVVLIPGVEHHLLHIAG